MLSDLESELFITQSSFSGSTSIELSENNFESLFAGADNEKAVDNFNLRTVLDIVLRNHFTPIKELVINLFSTFPRILFPPKQQRLFHRLSLKFFRYIHPIVTRISNSSFGS